MIGLVRPASRSLYHHGARWMSSAAPAPARREGGFVRGSIIGFLLGLTLAGSTAYVYLVDDYNKSSLSLLSSVEDLQKSTSKISGYSKKIEIVEGRLKEHVAQAATKSEVEALRNELLKLIDNANVAHLELKTEVWDLSKDIKKP
ncbi:uncharacterized protein BJ171DRAFT_518126 [Polychytrium aggregatum]|uniref:uncharacterized protein n=1 Tax=Polychytrium aggregatum TaxID=110093 RepID=UPI0022FDF895|nr:uncharacterized protein BJ171DRAFT_518126 [Polychytrium aggregatum]KAI9199643.1 hypothetical protein BJ171DRAFT_518126 [Polychytrium aggregatum]